METKLCPKCKEEKLLELFNKDKNKRDGLNRLCKSCVNKYYHPAYSAKRIKTNALLSEGMKECTKCKKTKPIKEFGIDNSHRDKLGYYCLECEKLRRKDRYNRLHDHILAQSKSYRAKSSDRINRREFLRKLNFKKQCVDYLGGKCSNEGCGYNKNLAALHFHHRDPKEKEYNLSIPPHKMNFEAVKPELDKCILLCANCHIELHNPNYIL